MTPPHPPLPVAGTSGEAGRPPGGAGGAARGHRARGAGRPERLGEAAWAALGAGMDGTLLRPGDRDFTAARKLANPRFDAVRPAAVAYCAGPGDVAECLAFARRFGVPVAVRSGGHSSAGWSTGSGRLVVDVQRMAEVSASGRSATVGAGAKLLDVHAELASHKRTIPAAAAPTVGISGLALGGGIGVVARAYGLTCDSLTGATLVTADGRERRVAEDGDADLFWALRGAGNGTFGVVTSLEFRTHVAPACLTFFLTWPWEHAADVVREWQRWAPVAPEEIWANLHLSAPAGGRPGSVRVSGLSLGARRELENHLDRLVGRARGPRRGPRTQGMPADLSLRRHSFLDAVKVLGGVSGWTLAQAHQRGTLPGRTKRGRVPRQSYAVRSDFCTRPLPPEGIRALVARVEQLVRLRGDGSGSVTLHALGGAVQRPRPDATAFVHRDARFLAQYAAGWQETAGAEAVAGLRGWLDATHAAMRPWASGFAYQNHPDPALRDWRHAYYGSNAERLTKIKAMHDPDRLFSLPQAL
ncbi:FAD-binding oxidoreductase [Streptomyces diacarni]|uniref:FAD-binding oxidoreductase n=1 Tax=Streptomyces diacarni TaxID=2800381 RepID=A0A367FFT9_9ACTN|nr:FAD-binding oxidoreductase [Streptomyces diacarni]RCG29174.1 FAD-binding oxidoreductase [Streptomyces diacarni]